MALLFAFAIVCLVRELELLSRVGQKFSEVLFVLGQHVLSLLLNKVLNLGSRDHAQKRKNRKSVSHSFSDLIKFIIQSFISSYLL